MRARVEDRRLLHLWVTTRVSVDEVRVRPVDGYSPVTSEFVGCCFGCEIREVFYSEDSAMRWAWVHRCVRVVVAS